MAVQTLEQRRAKHAFEAVETFMDTNAPRNEQSPKKERVPRNGQARKYVIHAKKLPVRIIASGLGQSLAFLAAKDYCPELLKSLSQWCLTKTDTEPVDANALLRKIVNGNSEDLRRHTAEALAYLQWIVRFVEGTGIKGEE